MSDPLDILPIGRSIAPLALSHIVVMQADGRVRLQPVRAEHLPALPPIKRVRSNQSMVSVAQLGDHDAEVRSWGRAMREAAVITPINGIKSGGDRANLPSLPERQVEQTLLFAPAEVGRIAAIGQFTYIHPLAGLSIGRHVHTQAHHFARHPRAVL